MKERFSSSRSKTHPHSRHYARSLDGTHRGYSQHQAHKRHHLSLQPTPPHHGIHNEVTREHLHTCSVYEHTSRRRREDALHLFELGRARRGGGGECGEADPETGRCRQGKGECEEGFEYVSREAGECAVFGLGR